MEKASLGTTPETTNTMKLLRAKTKTETKEFLDELTTHIKRVLDSLEGTQKVFYLIQSDMATGTVTIRFGSTIGIGDLPTEVQEQVFKETREEIAKEHGELNVTLEGTIPPKPSTTLAERIKQIEDVHFELKKKLSFTEQIQAQHDADVEREKEKEKHE